MVAHRDFLVDHLSVATIRDERRNGFVLANCMFPSVRWNNASSPSRSLPVATNRQLRFERVDEPFSI